MKQLTVIATNRPGLLADIAKTLGDRGVNIEALDVEGVDEHGLIVLAVDRYDEALRALRDAGYTAVTQDALLIRLDDKPGALAAAALRLKDAGLDLRSMHIIRREAGACLVSLVASDNAKAAALLADCLMRGRDA